MWSRGPGDKEWTRHISTNAAATATGVARHIIKLRTGSATPSSKSTFSHRSRVSTGGFEFSAVDPRAAGDGGARPGAPPPLRPPPTGRTAEDSWLGRFDEAKSAVALHGLALIADSEEQWAAQLRAATLPGRSSYTTVVRPEARCVRCGQQNAESTLKQLLGGRFSCACGRAEKVPVTRRFEEVTKCASHLGLEVTDDEAAFVKGAEAHAGVPSHFKPHCRCVVGGAGCSSREVPSFRVVDLLYYGKRAGSGDAPELRFCRCSAGLQQMGVAERVKCGLEQDADLADLVVLTEFPVRLAGRSKASRADLVVDADIEGPEERAVVAVEFDGPHHFGPFSYAPAWDRRETTDLLAKFDDQKKRDRLKGDFWTSRGVPALHVHVNDYTRAVAVVKEATKAALASRPGATQNFITSPGLYRDVMPSSWVSACCVL